MFTIFDAYCTDGRRTKDVHTLRSVNNYLKSAYDSGDDQHAAVCNRLAMLEMSHFLIGYIAPRLSSNYRDQLGRVYALASAKHATKAELIYEVLTSTYYPDYFVVDQFETQYRNAVAAGDERLERLANAMYDNVTWIERTAMEARAEAVDRRFGR